MRTLGYGCPLLLLLSGCPEPVEPACASEDEVFAWVDADGDGFGDPESDGEWLCAVPAGMASNNADCDDTNEARYPGAEDICDLLDNDCDDRIDQNDPKLPYYADADGDGYGASDDKIVSCLQPDGYVRDFNDCDDTRADVNPAAIEICNEGRDDDCDGLADDDDPGVDTTTYLEWHPDRDGDGFGDEETTVLACQGGGIGVSDGTDCDDRDELINPDGTEICNLRDDNCNGEADEHEDCPFVFVDDFDSGLDMNLWISLTGDGLVDASQSHTAPNSVNLGGGQATLLSVKMDTTACLSLEWAFWAKRGPETPDTGEDLDFDYWDGTMWVNEHYVPGISVTDNIFSLQSGVFGPDALHSDFQVRFQTTSGSGAGFDDHFIDDVEIICIE